MNLTEAQRGKAQELLELFESGEVVLEYQGKTYKDYKKWDQARISALKELRPQLQKFLNGSMGLQDFKEVSNKFAFAHKLWGFSSYSGQMFFNGIAKLSSNDEKTASSLRKWMSLPKSRPEAAAKIRDAVAELPGLMTSSRGLRLGSLPYFLSYFWQAQDPDFAPMYYHSARQTLESLGFFRTPKDLDQAFLDFWEIHDELANVYSKSISKDDNKHWFVEHVLWAYRQSRVAAVEDEDEEEPVPLLSLTAEDDLIGEELALIGTWKDIEDGLEEKQEFLAKNKFWLSVWSFRIKDDALPHLKKPFWVYINVGRGRLGYRLKVVDLVTGLQGVKCPWPELLADGHKGRSHTEDGSFKFRTWFKVSLIEKIDPPVNAFTARIAKPWTKSQASLLNQSSFGYFYPHAPGAPMEVTEGAPYSLEDAAQDLFLPRETLAEILDLLSNNKNVILQGPPGVGKSYMAQKIARAFIGADDASRIAYVQFHQSYGYEDFVQGYRPAKETDGFSLTAGTFIRFCDEARARPDSRFVFIIDEINRGNLSRILGELMLLIEADKRGPKWKLTLAQSDEKQPSFFVPGNVHILGMMNTADRSLAMVDYALRRRFAFVEIGPGFEDIKFEKLLLDRGATRALVAKIRAAVEALNKRISDDPGLGAGFCVGHSYFCPSDSVEKLDDRWYARVVERQVAPLIREYWFDKPKTEIDDIVKKLSR